MHSIFFHRLLRPFKSVGLGCCETKVDSPKGNRNGIKNKLLLPLRSFN